VSVYEVSVYEVSVYEVSVYEVDEHCTSFRFDSYKDVGTVDFFPVELAIRDELTQRMSSIFEEV